jgi:amino acid adenylation domain-containing protein/non-ribosomal peptide synthase protein (TIGR01720 family)
MKTRADPPETTDAEERSPADNLELLDLLLADDAVERPGKPELGRRHEGLPPPLSRAQRRIWFLQQIAPESPVYNIFYAVKLSGRLDFDALRSSLAEIVRRHEALRTCFPDIDGRPSATLLPTGALDIPIDDLSQLDERGRREQVSRLCEEEARRPFDLSAGPLLRLRLLRLEEFDHVALLGMHHIVADGWSMGVLVDELSRLYGAFVRGRASPLAEPTLQYGDFARWQEHWLTEDAALDQRRWWSERLAGLTPLDLPTDLPHPAEPSHRGASYAFSVPSRVASALGDLGRREGATVFMTLLAAFSVLLHRYTGQEDIVVGSPVANRNRREFEPLIGLFVNSLVMRCDLSGGPSFLTVLRRVRDFSVEALARQDLPFDELVKALAPERDASSNPLFQVMCSVESAPIGALRLPALTLTPVEVETRVAKFDLLLNISETANGLLAAAFEYATDLFEADTVARLAGHFTTLLEAIAADPHQCISMLSMLTTDQRYQLEIEWNRTETAFPRDKCIHDLFEIETQQYGEAVAVEFLDSQLSYRDLDISANRLAHRLRDLGVGDGQRVALLMERSLEVAIAFLGVLKAGGAYVPLSPDDPDERLALLLRDLAPSVVLTQARFAERLLSSGCPVLRLDEDWPAIATCNAAPPPYMTTPDSLAYVLYTSGSTGAPKGVCVSHRSVVRLVKGTNYARFGASEVFLQLAPLAFDASTFEIWGPLLNGGRLAVAPPHRPTLSEIGQCIRQHRVTTLWLTAGLFHVMVDECLADLKPLRQLLVGGDVLSVPHVLKAIQELDDCQLINGYGPTENTTFTCCYPITEPHRLRGSVPIGRPIANTRVYILDQHLQPTPIGVAGELCISGAGLAQGYLGRPDLTEERFIGNPFIQDPDPRLYKTGDICRYLPDGNIEFLGRHDNQVKVRGFRIELGEIETALVHHPAVREAAVLAREDRRGERVLVAYVVAEPGSDLLPQAVRKGMAEQLPGYMVPAKFVVLPALPLNENGKVDRKALPAPSEMSDRSDEYEPPRNPREQFLAKVWQEVLGRQAVGIHDNYFELGGDSITAIQIVSRLRGFGWRARVAHLFRHPTVADLAPALEEDDSGLSESEDADAAADIPLTAVQCWFFEHYRGDLNHFNQAVVLRPTERLDEGHLRRALGELLRRHDALRLSFAGEGALVRQACLSAAESPVLEVADLRRAGEPTAAIEQHAEAIQRGLDLQRGLLLRAGLFRLADGDRLLLAIHHLAVDAVSWRILLQELDLAYRQAAADQAVALGPKTCSFRLWAEEIRRFARGPQLNAEEAYWSQVETAAVTRLPLEESGSAPRHGDAETLHRSLSAEETTDLLTRVHRVFRTEIMDLLLTALGRALKRWSGGEAARITLEGHGREPPDERLDLSSTVGWFTSIYPFVLSVPGEDIGQQILRVKAALREIPRKGLGYGILRYVGSRTERSGAGSGPQLSFNYLGQFDDPGKGGLFSFSDEASGRAINPELTRPHPLDVVCMVAGGRMILSLEFDPRALARRTAAALLEDFAQRLGELVRYCRDSLEQRAPRSGSAQIPSPHLPVSGEVEDAYPLSPLQQGLLFQSLLEPASESYFVQVRFDFAGTLDPDAFREAWFELCRRHAVLRSAFIHQDLPRPMQVVLKDRQPEVGFDDLRHWAREERRARLEAFCLKERRRGFDLQRDPLLRLAVFREGDSDYHIVWSYHHILIDGWCLAILQRDFLEIYAALLDRRLPRLPPAAPYRNYIRWLEGQDRESARRFWRHYLKGYEHLATLPKLAGFDDGQPRALAEEILVLDADQSSGLVRLASQAGVTLNAVMLSLWGLLLSRYNDQEDVVLGTIVSGRPADLAGVEEMVGLFICAVPVRLGLKPDMLFPDLVCRVQDDALTSEAHLHLPLADIQLESALGRHLFDHMLIFENYPLRAAGIPAQSPARAEFAPVAAYDPTHYDLDITVVPGERITVKFTFDLRVYRPDQLQRTAGHLRMAVASILRDPEQRLREIDILPPSERDLLLGKFNATDAEYPRDRSFIDLFEEQAARTPDAIAMHCGDVAASYRDLNQAANRLGHHLRSQGVGPEVPVGLCVARAPEMIVGPLAILKAGGIFVPLDPDYPPSRLGFMMADAGICVLLTQQRLAARLPQHNARVVLLDADAPTIEAHPDENPPAQVTAGHGAYVIFTSGSTGQPKGVAVTHGSITNMAFAWRQAYGLSDFPVRLLQMASMSFDVFVGDLVRAFTNGGTVVVCPSNALVDPPSIYRLLVDHGISIFESTPALVLPLMEHIHHYELPVDALKVLIIGSDALPARHFHTLLERFGARLRLINSYGVTEATIDSSIFESRASSALDPMANTPIGKPLSNTRFYVLDRHRNPQPLGIPGELYIAGDGVARGYVNRAELTAARFVACSPVREERLYRTGDLARWRPDGNMEFLGRIDDQVKIRGYRIELGEIEDHLRRCESVKQAVVVAKELGAGMELAAYVAVESRWDVGRVRDTLRRFLPDYMVPSFFVRLDRLPLTPSGKVDRNALPDPRRAAEPRTASLPPRTATQTALAVIWRQVLQLDRIGVLDDFFELGGHSLKAMQITAQIHKAFNVQVPLRDFFDRPTISELADIIDAGANSQWSHIPSAPQQDHYELSHAQRRLWMLHHMEGATAYNMPEAYIIDTDIDAGVLNRAFQSLIERHESLRTAFVSIDGEPRQQVRAEVPFSVAEFDLREVPAAGQRAREIADRDINLPFDLTAPPLLRASVARLPGGGCLFALTIHHIVGDGWSGNLVYRELLTLYDAYLHGRPDPLEPLRIQYKDFAHWQNSRGFERQERYWLASLSDLPERLPLPYDFAPETVRDFSGGNEAVELSGEIAAGLRRLAIRRRTTLSSVILALFKLVLFHWTRQDDLCVGISVANRNHPDLENLIGFFVNILPIRCRLSADMDFDDLLALVIERIHEALEHQDYPFDLMVEKLNPTRRANRQPLVNVIYAFQNFADVHVDAGTAAATPAGSWERGDAAVDWAAFDFSFRTSKFDLTLFVVDRPDTIGLTFEYDSSLFLAATIRQQLHTIAKFAGMIADA